MKALDPERYEGYFAYYIEKVAHLSLADALKQTQGLWHQILGMVPEDKLDFAYDEGKWTMRQLLIHMSDTERIMAYRALWIARGDESPLPGYDENLFAQATMHHQPSKARLIREGMALRDTTMCFFDPLSDEEVSREGHFNGNKLSVLELGYLIAGHQQHHLDIITQRYIPLM